MHTRNSQATLNQVGRKKPDLKGLGVSLLALMALVSFSPATAQTAKTATPSPTANTGDALMDSFGLTSKNSVQTAGATTTPSAALAVKSLRGDQTFLMSAFPATSQNTLSLFSSYDGINFTSLASETYTPSTLLRDPSIMHAPDGFYYIVYTTQWGGQTFGVAKSADLRHWTHLSDITIDLPGLTNVWAPEWFRDKDGTMRVVVSLSKGGVPGPFAGYYLTADKTYSHFSKPVLMKGLEDNHIDTFPILDGDKYVVFTKNETTKVIERASADKLEGPWTFDAKGDWAGWGSWIEGPAVVRIKGTDANAGPNAGKDGWRIYFDDYITKHYWYSDSYDHFKTWTPRAELGGVSGAVRHFTVISEPTSVVEAATKPAAPGKTVAGKSITWDKRSLMIGGQRQMIWSGEFHPFRLPSPSLWRDVLQKMKASGFNAVTLYFDWGYHSTAAGHYDFSGVRNVELALQMAEEEGLYVIVRPGPYVNAELTEGGFPGYLARQKAVARTDDPEYLKAADEWLTQIDTIFARHQITNGGGNIILYQIENELSDTSDVHKRYMQNLADKAHADGITVPLFHNSAGRLPNWTPPTSTAPFAVSGPTDLYGFDGYPGGGCTNTTDPGKPNKVPNWGMYGDVTPDPKTGIVKVGALASPNTPGFAAEIGGGWFDFWGSVGTYECTAKKTGPDYERAFYGSSLINGLSIHSIYIAFGGTSWGWEPASVVYSSYDYGAPIAEDRSLRDKAYTLKQMGQFVQAANSLLADLDKGTPLTSSTANVKLYHDVGAKGEGDLVFAIHDPSNAETTDRFTFKLTTKDGSYTLPQSGTLQLKPQSVKMLVADYALARQHLVYTTSDLQTHLVQGAHDIALLYGRAGEDGETVLRYKQKPKVEVLGGAATSVYDAKSGDLRINYVHQGLTELRITAKGKPTLLLLLADDATAQQFSQQKTPTGPVLERSPAMIREVAFNSATLTLTGNTSAASTVTVWTPKPVKALTFNGASLPLKAQADGSLISSAVPGPDPVTLPDLMAQTWSRRMDSPEADPAFDDSKWRKADLTTSAATTATQPPAGQPVLSMSDYGFHNGDVWYRGRFTTSATTPDQLDIAYGGGGAGMAQVWIDGVFIGQDELPMATARPKGWGTAHFAVDATLLKPGAHEISVMVRNQSHNWDLGADDEHKEARGLISLSLSAKGAAPFATPVAWKIQGNQGGEDFADLVRGPLNNGGLYGERVGWYLPVSTSTDQTGWTTSAPDAAPPAPGTYWLRTTVKLDLPKDHDVQLGLTIGDPAKPQSSHKTRVLIFVNGWHLGNFAANIGPQHTFVLPPGIVNGNGDNTITLAVTTDGKPENSLEPVKLVNLHTVRGGVAVTPVAQPTQLQR